MKKVQTSMILAAAAMVCLPLAVTRCNVHGSSDDLAMFNHAVEAGEEASTSSDDATTETDDASTETTPEASSDAADKDGSAKDGGDAGDAAEPTGCAGPDGGLPCTPHEVACSSASCATPANACCATSFSSGAPVGTCGTAGACALGTTAVACEESADCASGSVCCETPNLGAQGTQTCATTCPLGAYQICRSDAECGSSPCIRVTCGVAPTYTLEVCGTAPAGCTAN